MPLHPSLTKLLAEAEARVASAPGPETARLIRNRADDLENAHTKAVHGHKRTLNRMCRDGVTAFDLRIAIDKLNLLARESASAPVAG